MLNVAVFFGGESCEHDISIITGEQLISNCNNSLYNIIPIYIDKIGVWYTGEKLLDIDNIKDNYKKCKVCTMVPGLNNLFFKSGRGFKPKLKIDVAILCMHGKNGEDGSLSALMQLCKVPYSACNICASSICLDKSIFKDCCKGMGICVVDGFVICENEYILNTALVKDKINELGLPVILKPCRQGSSIGIELCKNYDELDAKMKSAFMYDKKILIEKYIDVEKEINIAILDDKGISILSKTEEPVSCDEILSFDEKYRKNEGGFETIKRICPAQISNELEEKLKKIAVFCYSRLDLFGIVRFDFIISKDNVLYLNEINTIPGSMANYLFDKELYGYSKLIDMIVSNAIYRKNKEDEVVKVFDSDILSGGFDGFKK